MVKIFQSKFFKVLLSLMIVSALIFLLSMIYRYEQKIEDEMFRISTSDVFEITQHKAKHIKAILKNSDNYIKRLKTDKALRTQLEQNVKNLITNNIKYAYVLYKDKNDVFRFLIDGSPEDEKSMLNQKFDVTSDKWYELYNTKEPTIITHNVLQKLSISYLVPILNKNSVELVLAIDFSIDKISGINKIINMMKTGVIIILSIIFMIIVVLIAQFIRLKTIKKRSFIDRLTNVYNRNYLDEIEEKISLEEYILIVMDIDHFKKVNDSYGHDNGDTVLKEIGTILLSILRTSDDIAIRYGGEEFILLIKNKHINTELSLSIVQRIFDNIKNHKFYIGDNEYINITTSVGVNLEPWKSKNFKDAFKVADVALYEAKNSGRDNIKYKV